MFYVVPVSPFSPFSPFLPSLPSLPGIPTFPSAPGGPFGPGLPGNPGDPGTLQIKRGAPFTLASNSCPKTQWHRQTAPIKAHILRSAKAKNNFSGNRHARRTSLMCFRSESYKLACFLGKKKEKRKRKKSAPFVFHILA